MANMTVLFYLQSKEATPETMQQETTTTNSLIPTKSAKTYEKFYAHFMDWKDKNKFDTFSENVVATYFEGLAKQLKSTTLWTQYSILKSTLFIKQNVDISKYSRLQTLLKRKSEGYKPKKAKTFSTNEIKQFIENAPDMKYLMFKVSKF